MDFTNSRCSRVKYTVEIIGNNSFASINYTYGSPQSVAPNTYDIWVNGVLAGNDLNKGLLASGANISSMMFYGISSTGNAANLLQTIFQYLIQYQH